MVLSSHSRCMILTWGRSFDPLFSTSRADMWSLWVGRVLHTLVTYMLHTLVIHEGLELNQIPILWDVKEMEGDELMLRKGIWSFIWTPCLQLFGRVGFSSLIFNFLFLENNPLSLLLIWFSYFGVSWWEYLVWDDWVYYGDFGCTTAGGWYLAVDVNPGLGGWQTKHLRLANDGCMKEIDRQMASSISLTDTPLDKAIITQDSSFWFI